MNLSKEINDKHIFAISKLLSFIFFASKTAALKRTTIHQTGLLVWIAHQTRAREYLAVPH